jgi:DNA-binding MltR family transcriptional regulator
MSSILDSIDSGVLRAVELNEALTEQIQLLIDTNEKLSHDIKTLNIKHDEMLDLIIKLFKSKPTVKAPAK